MYPPGIRSERTTAIYECANCGREIEVEGVRELGAFIADVEPDECPECGLDPLRNERPECPCGGLGQWDDWCFVCDQCGAEL